jgi:hypothetical protein
VCLPTRDIDDGYDKNNRRAIRAAAQAPARAGLTFANSIMNGTPKKTFRIFYSWQSDLPDQVNAHLIRGVLGEVATAMTGDAELQMKTISDEATRDVPGSPDIVDTIFEKIRLSDAFVCDISKVHEFVDSNDETRKFCNPNVAIELGYAVRELGWKRIILVFNEAYGKLPNDLPFDTHGNRASKYNCGLELDSDKKITQNTISAIANAKGLLKTNLTEALRLIAVENPKRPRELEEKSPEQIRRERDVEQLKHLFYWLNLDVLNHFIERLCHSCLTVVGTDFFECFSRVVKSPKFHINDPELRLKAETFFRAWEESFCDSHSMDLRPNGNEAYFILAAGDIPRYPEQMAEMRRTREKAAPLRAALDSLLGYVRANFLEIDPTKCGHEAFAEYIKEQKRP